MPAASIGGAASRAAMVRDGAEPVIGPRFARTRWRLLTMRAGMMSAHTPTPHPEERAFARVSKDGLHKCRRKLAGRLLQAFRLRRRLRDQALQFRNAGT